MAIFLEGPELACAIRDILAEDDVRAAVAFWGKGSEAWVTGTGARIVANLRMGGTNPYALEKVPATIRQCDTLHAKVYLGAHQAVVCSANASINGLSLEGSEQAGWREAGMLVDLSDAINDWFEDMWTPPQSSTISSTDWSEAKRLWKLRQTSFRPSVASFADFDVEATELPLITWYSDDDAWTTNHEAVAAVIGVGGGVADRRVEDGLWIRHPDDAKVLADRWVLVWRRLADGRPSKIKPDFVQMSDVLVEGGFSWADGRPQDVLLAAERQTPPPFDPGEQRFRDAMTSVLVDNAFAGLCDGDGEYSIWYAERLPLMREFWRAVKAAYDRPAGLTAAKSSLPTEEAFAEELKCTYDACVALHYHPEGMMRMIQQHGAIEAARLLVAKPSTSGLARLAMLGRLDLSIEAIIQREPWCQLFAPELRERAARRLR